MSSGKWRPFCLGLNVLSDSTAYEDAKIENMGIFMPTRSSRIKVIDLSESWNSQIYVSLSIILCNKTDAQDHLDKKKTWYTYIKPL